MIVRFIGSTYLRPMVRVASVALLAALPVAGLLWHSPVLAAKAASAVPPPAVDETVATAPAEETAVFAGGCFWGVQGVFQHVTGVTNAVSGYAGGDKSTAEYETVSGGRTGHAESVRISYDPKRITYGKLLQIYFSVAHDPTQLNRQGPDTGPQYRSALFPQNDDQKRVAEAYIAQLDKAGAFPKPIATKAEPFKGFFTAEGYHQNYLTLNPRNPYIAYNDLPKIEDLKRVFPDLYRADPVLVTAATLSN